MKSNEYKLETINGAKIHVYEWLPDDSIEIKGVLQIAHGMAEHAGRYFSFARFLTNNGYAVYANDHKGHGKTAGQIDKLGFWGKKDGWDKLVADFKSLSSYIVEKHPEKAFFVFGHSMGSFLVRSYLLNPLSTLNGAILSGTAGNPGVSGKIGMLLLRFLLLFYPPNRASKLIGRLSFSLYNKKFKPNRTQFDWLSRDIEQVDLYVKDPFCGFLFSLQSFYDMLKALFIVNRQSTINLVAKDLPLLFFAGDKDPVGNNAKGVKEVYRKFIKAGAQNSKLKLFKEGRHEMLNELNKKEVYQLVLEWLNNINHH